MSNSLEQILIYNKLKKCENIKELINEDILDKFYLIDSIIQKSRENVSVEYYTTITSNKRFIGKIVIAYKRFVRKSISFIFATILKNQTDENFRLVQALYEMSEVMKDLHKETKKNNLEFEKKIGYLNEQLMMQENTNKKSGE